MSYGPIMIGIEDINLNSVEKKLIAHPLIGGIILFQKNFLYKGQIKDLIENCQSIRTKLRLPRLLTAVDHEGGFVQRFRGEGFTDLPAAISVGKYFQQDRIGGTALIRAIAHISALELGSVGIDLSLGPVLDIQTNAGGMNASRCYSHNPHMIAQVAAELIRQIQGHGLHCAAKHFPGSGLSSNDPHYFISISKVREEQIIGQDLLPYAVLCKEKLLKALILSQQIYINIDNKPVPISTKWIHTILRKRLNFRGAIITDCLQMLGASLIGNEIAQRIESVLQNGCEIALVSQSEKNFYEKLYNTLQTSFLAQFQSSVNVIDRESRIAPLFKKYPNDYYEKLLQANDYLNSKALIEAFQTRGQPTQRKTKKSFNGKKLIPIKTMKKLYYKFPFVKKGVSLGLKTAFRLKLKVLSIANRFGA